MFGLEFLLWLFIGEGTLEGLSLILQCLRWQVKFIPKSQANSHPGTFRGKIDIELNFHRRKLHK